MNDPVSDLAPKNDWTKTIQTAANLVAAGSAIPAPHFNLYYSEIMGQPKDIRLGTTHETLALSRATAEECNAFEKLHQHYRSHFRREEI